MTHAEKERILIDLLPRIRVTAAKFCKRVFIDREEAIQEASLAARKALDDFEPDRGWMPWTFLYRRVIGAMLDYARCKSHPLGSVRVHKHKPLMSLSHLAYAEGQQTTLAGTIPDHRRGSMEAITDQEAFDDVTKRVQPRERAMLAMAYRDDQTQVQIGEAIGVSESRVNQIFKTTFQRLRAVMPQGT